MSRIRDLRARLAGHVPADGRESAHLTRMRRMLDGDADPFARSRWDPGHVTSSGYVLSPGGDAVLMVHHTRLARWLQPGGHVEPSDPDVLSAAVREVREETGLQSLVPLDAPEEIFDIDIHPIPARPAEPAHEHFDVRFLFRAGGDRIRGGSDVDDVAWVELDRLASAGADESTHRVVVKILRRLRC